ncbi:MAG TPA: DNA gyrase modulator, partial [Acidobacteriota bacterium]
MSTNQENLKALAENLVAYGRRQGASEIEVTVVETSRFAVNVREQNVERLTEAGTKDLGMRVFVDGKLATAGSQDLAETTLHRIVDNAIARARLGGTDPFAGLPEAEPIRVS